MRIGLLFCLITSVACNDKINPSALIIQPKMDYMPAITNAGQLSYGEPGLLEDPDPYLNNNWVVEVRGSIIGQFELGLINASGHDLTNVKLIVMANDTSKISGAFFSRIYRTLFWGGSAFADTTPFIMPDGNIYPTEINGNYFVIDADDLPAKSTIVFNSIVLGDVGLKLHFAAYANATDDQYVYSAGQMETSVSYEAVQ